MNIQQLEYILAVDQFRHFAKAAEHCHVTQPTLSMMIQKLEDELGVKLFDRTAQPVKPTPAGTKVIEQARVVLYQTSLIKDIVKEEEQSLSGTFRLAVLPTIAPYLLPRFFAQLTERYPDLDIRILEMKTTPSLAALQRGEIDAAIIANQPKEPQLQAQTLFYEQFFGYVAKGDPLFKKALIRTADISDEHLWLLDEGHCFRDQLLRFCQMEKVKVRQAAYRLGSMETFMRMVESGNGDFYKTVNSVFQAVINNGNAKKNLVECNGKYYFSSSIFVICSKSGGKNAAKLNGLYENHLQKITVPENSIVSAFLSVANVYGYADASFIAPDEKPQYRH